MGFLKSLPEQHYYNISKPSRYINESHNKNLKYHFLKLQVHFIAPNPNFLKLQVHFISPNPNVHIFFSSSSFNYVVH